MTYSHVTFMFCLPRSQSEWISWFVGHGCVAWHDPLKLCDHPDQLVALIEEWTGKNPGRRLFIADTLAVCFRERLCERLPGVQTFSVVRPAQEVARSLEKQGATAPAKMLEQMEIRCKQEIAGFAYGYMTEDSYKSIYAYATSQTWSGHVPLDTHIEVPIADQVSFPDRLAKLMRHIEL